MKSTLVLAATGAVLASAGPVEPRAVVTNVVYHNVVVTETVFAAAATQAATVDSQIDAAPEGDEFDADPFDPVAFLDSQMEKEPKEPQVQVVPSSSPSPSPSPQPQPKIVYPFKQQAKTPSKSTSQPQGNAQPASSASQQQGNGQLSSFESTILKYHNDKRALHGAGAMTWNATLAKFAQDKAKIACDETNLSHNNDGYGQNLAFMDIRIGKRDGNSDASYATQAADMWYSEGKNYGSSYGQSSPAGGPVTGHFTQMVWKGSNGLGCAVTTGCQSRRRARGLSLAARGGQPDTVVVCNYYEQGNILGYYGQNVSPPSTNGQ